jgi:hypothetical protein
MKLFKFLNRYAENPQMESMNVNTVVTVTFFMKLNSDWFFAKRSYTEFHENPTNVLIFDKELQTDGRTWSSHKRYVLQFKRTRKDVCSCRFQSPHRAT